MDEFTNQSFNDPDDRFIPAISNSSLYYIMNEYYEYQIGDWVINHINNDQRLSYHIDDTNDIRDGVRRIPKGDLIESIDIPKDVVISEGAGPDGGGGPFGGSWGHCTYHVIQIDCCQFRIWGHCGGLFNQDADGTILIEFKDNDDISVEFDVNGSYSETINMCDLVDDISDLSNPNNSSGVEDITLDINASNHGLGSDVDGEVIISSNITCSNADDRSTDWPFFENGNIGFSYNLELKNSRKASAEIVYFEFDVSDWQQASAELSLEINHVSKNTNCQEEEQEDDDKSRPNVRKLKVRANLPVAYNFHRHCTGDIWGSFQAEPTQGGSFIVEDEIEFDCCNVE